MLINKNRVELGRLFGGKWGGLGREGGFFQELYISHALQVGVVRKKKNNDKKHQFNSYNCTVVKVITDIQVLKQRK